MQERKISRRGPSSYRQLEDVIGCRWSVSALQAVGSGISRPGALEKYINGISTEVPPHTEYSLTAHGRKVVAIIEQFRQLDESLEKKS